MSLRSFLTINPNLGHCPFSILYKT
jgi:hypothetical protein